MGRELGLVLFIAAGLALFAYDSFDFFLAAYHSRFLTGVALVVLVVFLVAWWRRR